MPALLAGPLAQFGSMGVSNAIALGGLGLGAAATGATFEALDDYVVGISSIRVTATPGGGVFIGDRVTIRGECRVSFGDMYSGGTGKAALFEVDRKGSTMLAMQTFKQDQRQDRPVTMTAVVAGLQYMRPVDYFMAVEVTGEDDVTFPRDFWPGDEQVTRSRRSDPVTLKFENPYLVEPKHESPSDITHGEDDFYDASAVNFAQFPVEVATRWASSNLPEFSSPPSGPPPSVPPPPRPSRLTPIRRTSIAPRGKPVDINEVNLRDRDHPAATHRERNPISYRPTLEIISATMVIEHAAGPPGSGIGAIKATWQDPQAPFTPSSNLMTRCTVDKPREVGLVVPREEGFLAARVEPTRRRAAFSLLDVDDQPVAFKATVFDDYGGQARADSSAPGIAVFDDDFAGPFGTFVATATGYEAISIRFPFDRAEGFIEGQRFQPTAGPTIRGVVTSPDFGPIGRAMVTLAPADEGSVAAVPTASDGSFAIGTTATQLSGEPTLRVELPRYPFVHWAQEIIETALDPERLARGEPVVVTARLATTDAPRVELSGRVGLRDKATRSLTPVTGATVELFGAEDIVATARSDDAGRYAVTVPPGLYGLRIKPPEALVVAPVEEALVQVSADRSDVDVRLRVPRPQLVDLGEQIRVHAPAGLGVALVAEEGVIEVRPPSGDVVTVERSDLDNLGISAFALSLEGGSSSPVPVPPNQPSLAAESADPRRDDTVTPPTDDQAD